MSPRSKRSRSGDPYTATLISALEQEIGRAHDALSAIGIGLPALSLERRIKLAGERLESLRAQLAMHAHPLPRGGAFESELDEML